MYIGASFYVNPADETGTETLAPTMVPPIVGEDHEEVGALVAHTTHGLSQSHRRIRCFVAKVVYEVTPPKPIFTAVK